MVMRNGPEHIRTVPPHDVMGECAEDHLPQGEEASFIQGLMADSVGILKEADRRGSAAGHADLAVGIGQGAAASCVEGSVRGGRRRDLCGGFGEGHRDIEDLSRGTAGQPLFEIASLVLENRSHAGSPSSMRRDG